MQSLRWKRAMMRRRESDRGTLHLEDLEQSRCRRFHFVFRVPEPLPFALSKWRLYFCILRSTFVFEANFLWD